MGKIGAVEFYACKWHASQCMFYPKRIKLIKHLGIYAHYILLLVDLMFFYKRLSGPSLTKKQKAPLLKITALP